MRQPDALVLLGVITPAGIVAAGSLRRGVNPEFAKFFASTETFTCIGKPSIVLKPFQVNDNSCDCPDGSDEPGTAACAHLDSRSPAIPLPGSSSGTTNTTTAFPGFWCFNEGHVGRYVPFMYVNDGVCDYDLCCDGSEEYSNVGGVKCQNKCDEMGKEYRRVEEERKKIIETAKKKRRTLAKEARELRRRTESKINNLKEDVRALEVKRADLQKKVEDAERSDKGRAVKNEGPGKLGVLVGLAKTRISELRDTLNKVMDQRNRLQNRVDELEEILRKFKEEYNPNFNDEGVKTAVKSWEDYAAKTGERAELSDGDIDEVAKEDSETWGINWAEFQEDASDADMVYNFEAYLPDFLRDFIHQKLNVLRIWMIENGLMADKPTTAGDSHLVKAAREVFQAAADEHSQKSRELGDQERELDGEYGPDEVFRALKNKCLSTMSGEYEYELCWLGRTSQKSKKAGSNTSMGEFVRIDRDMSDEDDRTDGKGLGKGERIVLRYENGQGCWNGPNRRTDVWLACAETDEIWRVSECEKCVYRMEVGTPAACEDGQAAVRAKDEL